MVALIDESADTSIYRVGALVLRVNELEPLRLGLEYVVAKAVRDYDLERRIELHGHEIFHGNKGWSVLKKMPRARIQVYRSALEIIAEHSEAIMIRGVHREAFKRRYRDRPDWNEHENALTYLIENLDIYAERAGVPMHLFADNCRFAEATLAHLRRFKTWGTWGYRSRVIEHITDLRYRDSENTREIQAADLVCYLDHRIRGKRDKDPRAIRANEHLWGHIEHLVRIRRDWHP